MTPAPRPLIAINGLYHAEDPMLRLRQRYPDAIRRAGGVPVVLAPGLIERDEDEDEVARELDAILGSVDGLLLTGGDDFHAGPLGLGVTHPSAEVTHLPKQRYDLALTRAALARDLPTLGICFGMQCLGLAGGATLHQDLPPHLPDGLPRKTAHTDSALHLVAARDGTKLAKATGLGPFRVVSRHHQALRTIPPPWIVSAMDEENLIEAIEHPGHSYAVGVQWHPELSSSLEGEVDAGAAPAAALLRSFIRAAAESKS